MSGRISELDDAILPIDVDSLFEIAEPVSPGVYSSKKSTVSDLTDQIVSAVISTTDVMVFKGVIDCSTNPNYPAADRGDTYRVSVSGKIGGASGPNVEVADIIVCLTDGTASGTQAAVGANWSIIQANIDGAVVGPSSAVDSRIAAFDGTTGKIIKDGGILTSSLLTSISELRITYNGNAVIPASQATAGLAITSNYGGANEVTLWSIVPVASGSNMGGFNFRQRLTGDVDIDLGYFYGDDNFSEIDIIGGGAVFFFGINNGSDGFSGSFSNHPFGMYTNNLERLHIAAGGAVWLNGSSTNDNAAAGKYGEYTSSNIVIGSAVALTTATSKTVTSISLTAGDWDVTGTVAFAPAAGTLITDMKGGLSQTNNTLPTLSDLLALVDFPISPAAGVGATIPVGKSRISLSATGTIYLVAQATFTVSTCGAYGFISARRVR